MKIEIHQSTQGDSFMTPENPRWMNRNKWCSPRCRPVVCWMHFVTCAGLAMQPMLKACIARIVYQHPSVESFRRELQRNPSLMLAYGFKLMACQNHTLFDWNTLDEYSDLKRLQMVFTSLPAGGLLVGASTCITTPIRKAGHRRK